MRLAAAVSLVALLGLGACGGEASFDPSADDSADRPPGCAESVESPDGRAAAELAIKDDVISPDQGVRFSLENQGDVDLITGMPFTVERWDGDVWTKVPGQPTAWTMQAIWIKPGGAMRAQSWPTGDAAAFEPGWYRVVKSASFERPGGAVDLKARACFEVRA